MKKRPRALVRRHRRPTLPVGWKYRLPGSRRDGLEQANGTFLDHLARFRGDVTAVGDLVATLGVRLPGRHVVDGTVGVTREQRVRERRLRDDAASDLVEQLTRDGDHAELVSDADGGELRGDRRQWRAGAPPCRPGGVPPPRSPSW